MSNWLKGKNSIKIIPRVETGVATDDRVEMGPDHLGVKLLVPVKLNLWRGVEVTLLGYDHSRRHRLLGNDHRLLGLPHLSVGVLFGELAGQILLDQMDPVQLVADGDPVGLDVVGPAEQLQLSRAGGKPLDDAVDLVGLVRGGPHLRHQNVAVQTLVHVRGISLDADEAMFLAVVQPVTFEGIFV